MVIFSFIVNFVLVLVLVGAGIFIFQIKNEIAQPLIQGLHSTATGLDEATIDWTIPVRDTLIIEELPVQINENTITSQVTEIDGAPVPNTIPGETVVTLTRDVPISIQGAFIDAGNLQLTNATVNITLPQGTQLPVALDLAIALRQAEIPVNLDVRAVIPLRDTQLHDPFETLALLFEPLAIGLHNLPSDFGEGGDFVGQILGGAPIPELLLATDGSGFNPVPYDPWPGFSRTAGVDYQLFGVPFPDGNPVYDTGLVVPGGIPALDSQLERRSPYYQDDLTPEEWNEAQAAELGTNPEIAPDTWNGAMEENYDVIEPLPTVTTPATVDTDSGSTTELDAQGAPAVGGAEESDPDGILPTPTSP
jgi:hypothetical protein